MIRCFIGVGANLGDPVGQCLSAVESLNLVIRSKLVMTSSLYRSDPMGPPGQPPYINAVTCLETTLDAHALLDQLQLIETDHHRCRDGIRWSARTLDLDLLLYGSEIISTERLTVPHPGITTRSFVIMPLLELAPAIDIPGIGAAADYADACPAYGLTKLTSPFTGVNPS